MGSHEVESEPEEPFICSITGRGRGGQSPPYLAMCFPGMLGNQLQGTQVFLEGRERVTPFLKVSKKKKKNLLLNILSTG